MTSRSFILLASLFCSSFPQTWHIVLWIKQSTYLLYEALPMMWVYRRRPHQDRPKLKKIFCNAFLMVMNSFRPCMSEIFYFWKIYWYRIQSWQFFFCFSTLKTLLHCLWLRSFPTKSLSFLSLFLFTFVSLVLFSFSLTIKFFCHWF